MSARLMAKVSPEPNTGCWLWTGYVDAAGYGQAYWAGRAMSAHVAVYLALVGPIGDGLEIDHLCRVRWCVNPTHLEPVTHRVNMLRGNTTAAAHAVKTECIHGHPFDRANTIIRSNGNRDCRACKGDRQRARS